eukprot:6135571-Prymnesium_polylepis.1
MAPRPPPRPLTRCQTPLGSQKWCSKARWSTVAEGLDVGCRGAPHYFRRANSGSARVAACREIQFASVQDADTIVPDTWCGCARVPHHQGQARRRGRTRGSDRR